jgi:hypothetical protein
MAAPFQRFLLDLAKHPGVLRSDQPEAPPIRGVFRHGALYF